MLAFVRGLYKHRLRIKALFAPDVVIASSTYPFDFVAARSIARLTGARLIFELHDLWPLSPMELGGMSRWHPFIVATQLAEDYVCRWADKVVSLLPRAESHLAERGLAPGKFEFIPNGVVLDDWEQCQENPLPAEAARRLAEIRAAGEKIVTRPAADIVPIKAPVVLL